MRSVPPYWSGRVDSATDATSGTASCFTHTTTGPDHSADARRLAIGGEHDDAVEGPQVSGQLG